MGEGRTPEFPNSCSSEFGNSGVRPSPLRRFLYGRWRRRRDSHSLQSIVGIGAERRIGILGNHFLVVILCLIRLVVRFVYRGQLIRNRGFRVTARVVKALVRVDRLLIVAMLLVNGTQSELRYSFHARITVIGDLLQALNGFCR